MRQRIVVLLKMGDFLNHYLQRALSADLSVTL